MDKRTEGNDNDAFMVAYFRIYNEMLPRGINVTLPTTTSLLKSLQRPSPSNLVSDIYNEAMTNSAVVYILLDRLVAL
jgi:hypothetical protein